MSDGTETIDIWDVLEDLELGIHELRCALDDEESGRIRAHAFDLVVHAATVARYVVQAEGETS
jgi:hypothetical protein